MRKMSKLLELLQSRWSDFTAEGQSLGILVLPHTRVSRAISEALLYAGDISPGKASLRKCTFLFCGQEAQCSSSFLNHNENQDAFHNMDNLFS